ncbi:hypothetical protein ACFQ7B_40140 [Streptomyces erythrochromogenes]|uniref:hypothetical protein n=1 Tax=Streptomyces erythrochromogenes TaxID=285574 RepID=UPI0036876FB5
MRLTKSQIVAVLARQRRHHRDRKAASIQAALREPQLGLPAPVTAAYAAAVTAHAQVLTALNEQIDALEAE